MRYQSWSSLLISNVHNWAVALDSSQAEVIPAFPLVLLSKVKDAFHDVELPRLKLSSWMQLSGAP